MEGTRGKEQTMREAFGNPRAPASVLGEQRGLSLRTVAAVPPWKGSGPKGHSSSLRNKFSPCHISLTLCHLMSEPQPRNTYQKIVSRHKDIHTYTHRHTRTNMYTHMFTTHIHEHSKYTHTRSDPYIIGSQQVLSILGKN